MTSVDPQPVGAAGRLPAAVRKFAEYLTGLVGRLDRDRGWCGVFSRRDPEGLRACLDGREEPPWDVVESLLQDLATHHGEQYAEQEAVRGQALHAAALAARDSLPGARDRLTGRLDLMLREHRSATARRAELTRTLHAAPAAQRPTAERDLAWAEDDLARAAARCAELRARLAVLGRPPAAGPAQGPGRGAGPGPARGPRPGPGPGPGPGPSPGAPRAQPTPGAPSAPPAPGASRRPPGLAGTPPGPAAQPAPAAPHARPAPAAPHPPPGPGAPQTRPGPRAPHGQAGPGPANPWAGAGAPDEQAVAAVVATLLRLRREGRGGEAHALLANAACWPPGRLPLLAAELGRAGLGADWATLLWEAASLPTRRLVELAGTLTAGGFGVDGARLLRQGVARPSADVGEAVLTLLDEGRNREAHDLLDACVRARTAVDAASCATIDPARLVPLLTEAAGQVSEACRWDLLHAFRVAGLTY